MLISRRRCKIAYVPEDVIVDILDKVVAGRAMAYPVLSQLPEGYEVDGIVHDGLNRRFAVRVLHPSFDEVPSGEPIPDLGVYSDWETLIVSDQVKESAGKAVGTNPDGSGDDDVHYHPPTGTWTNRCEAVARNVARTSGIPMAFSDKRGVVSCPVCLERAFAPISSKTINFSEAYANEKEDGTVDVASKLFEETGLKPRYSPLTIGSAGRSPG